MKTRPPTHASRPAAPRRAIGFLLASAICAIGLFAGGCGQPGTVYGYQAEEFFTGAQLNIARAIVAGDMAEVRRLAPGVDLNAHGKKDMTLMWFAVVRQNYEAAKTLVALGVDPDKQIAQGLGSALDSTMRPRKDPNDQSGIRMLQAMLDGGLSPNYKTQYQTSLVQRAAGPGGSLAAVRLLVERGADINVRDSIGGTALDDALDTRHPDIALYLIQHGADFNTHITNGASTTWGVYRQLQRLAPGPMRTQFEQVRDLMIKKGAKWPPDSPEVVRDQMRAQGLTPDVPPGHKR